VRAAFLLVLLVNLAFFAWQHDLQRARPAPPAPAPAQDGGSPELKLLLLSERDGRGRSALPAESTAAAALPVAAGAAGCFSIGPYATAREAASAAEGLRLLGVEGRQRTSERHEPSGYWVYLPPYRTRELALAASRELADRGVKDRSVVSTAGKENAVSLGFFQSRARAEQRRADIAALGYAPVMEERYRTRFEYWLDTTNAVVLTGEMRELLRGEGAGSDFAFLERTCE
jgi:hypothetical protein